VQPAELDPDAARLLGRHGYLWDDWFHGFRRERRVGGESTEEYLKKGPIVISFEELRDHGLLAPEAPSVRDRAAGLAWLAVRIKSAG
jgi:hypothetical protein